MCVFVCYLKYPKSWVFVLYYRGQVLNYLKGWEGYLVNAQKLRWRVKDPFIFTPHPFLFLNVLLLLLGERNFFG